MLLFADLDRSFTQSIVEFRMIYRKELILNETRVTQFFATLAHVCHPLKRLIDVSNEPCSTPQPSKLPCGMITIVCAIGEDSSILSDETAYAVTHVH